MRIWSYVAARFEDGSKTGVPRFDWSLRKIFPDLHSVTKLPAGLTSKDVVITDNHLSLDVPEHVRTIVVHHGSAGAHFARDPNWRNDRTRKMVSLQLEMFQKKNRRWVAPSAWVAADFAQRAGLAKDYAAVVPHWVKPYGPAPSHGRKKPVVIGDWRDHNKGLGVVQELRRAAPDIEFRTLSFQPGMHEPFYMEADLYLCLSVSEGASYSVADAEACGLPIVTTDVGNVLEFVDSEVLAWEDRDNVELVLGKVRAKLAARRSLPGFYEKYTYDAWASSWRGLVETDVKVVPHHPAPPPVPPPPAPKKPAPEPPPTPLYQKPPGQLTIIGLGGGIGNALFNLPLMHALTSMGRRLAAYVQTDYPAADLFLRCRYLEAVIRPDEPVPNQYDCSLIAGPWRPRNMIAMPQVKIHTWAREPFYPEPEWSLLLKFARELGWNGRKPDVSDWCRGLNRERRWDVGIVQGCKPEDRWRRKRYPGMAQVAARFLSAGLSVAVFGTEDDRDPELPIPGEDLLGKFPIEQMPDALAGCRVVVGTDSGMTHLASSLGVPVVMIYTATNDVKGDPVGLKYIKLYRDIPCSPCQSTYRWDQCDNWICRAIPEDDVFRAAISLLEWTNHLWGIPSHAPSDQRCDPAPEATAAVLPEVLPSVDPGE